MIRLNISALTFALCLGSSSALAHELWIDPAAYQVAPGVSTTAHLRNGERFAGSPVYYNPASTVRFEHHYNGSVIPVRGRLGDEPAIMLFDLEPGLHVLAYQSKISKLTYKTWDKFATFAAHKDFPTAVQDHMRRRLPRDGFREIYTRYSKALFAVGDGKGNDVATGLDTEIVALSNPYTTSEKTLPVRVLYNGQPRTNAQIEYFEKTPDKTVTITRYRTDEKGEARLPIKPGHQYLVDAVVLREPSAARMNEFDAVWETLWAALTFAVPE